jgi:hypothetical protein
VCDDYNEARFAMADLFGMSIYRAGNAYINEQQTTY